MKLISKTLLSACMLAAIASTAAAEDPDTSLNGWLEKKIQNIIEANVDLRGESRQTETPSQTDNSTALVDRGSSALVGLALNLAGLPTSSEDGNDSAASVTLNAYSLFAAFKGVDPLSPTFYKEHATWRRVSLTVGYDDEATADGSTQKVQLLGGKWLIIDRRQPEAQSQNFEAMQGLITKAGVAYGALTDKIKDHVLDHLLSQEEMRQRVRDEYRAFLAGKGKSEAELTAAVEGFEIGPGLRPTRVEEREYFSDFKNQLFAQGFEAQLAQLGPEVERELEQIVEDDAESADLFIQLEKQTQKLLNDIRKAPQFSFSALSKQRPEGADDYSGQLIYEQGFGPRVNFVANGSYDYTDNKGEEEDVHNERIALALDFQMGQEQIVGKSPFRFSLAAEAKRMSAEEKDTWKAQAKLMIPLMDGVEFPISVTFASDTDLIEEEDVRGNFGFTLDVARLVDALKSNG